jgi:hypothetical protein
VLKKSPPGRGGMKNRHGNLRGRRLERPPFPVLSNGDFRGSDIKIFDHAVQKPLLVPLVQGDRSEVAAQLFHSFRGSSWGLWRGIWRRYERRDTWPSTCLAMDMKWWQERKSAGGPLLKNPHRMNVNLPSDGYCFVSLPLQRLTVSACQLRPSIHESI